VGTELDAVSSGRIRLLYPDVAIRFIRVFNDMHRMFGKQLRVTEGLRTFKRQEELYALGRTQPGRIVTYARPGQSLHNFGLALDVCFLGKDPWLEKEPELWEKFGQIAEGHGFAWGGAFKKFKDRPHIEIAYGLGLEELQAFYWVDGLKAVWATIDLDRGMKEGAEWTGPLARAKLVNPGELA
jgi:peptidoglycan LD-endopeptidase CwlK